MSNCKAILITVVLAVLLMPSFLFADEIPSGQPAVKAADKGVSGAVVRKDTPEDAAAPDVAADAGPGDGENPEAPAPSEFIHLFDTTILPAGHENAAAAGSKPYMEVPTSALDRAMLNSAPAYSEDVKGPVEKNIRMFTSGLKERFSTWLSRSGRYVGLMKSIFRENYMPEELVFLSLIESGFNPKAYSWANASGPWQFISGTGKRYGLRIDRWVDERRDPIKSTKAAAAYLKDLYDMFGTWSLAMASYNAGEGNVARAVNRGGTLDFWELRKAQTLPQETKEYVPKFIAAKMIAQNPVMFGFDSLEYERPFEFDEVVVKKTVSLRTVARCCGVTEGDIKDLNPELIRSCTPPNNPGYTLRVPKGTRELFLANYDGTPDTVSDQYVVRRGDTLKKVARKLGTTTLAICEANGIKKLRVGQRLEIPVPETAPVPTKTVVAANTAVETSGNASGDSQVTTEPSGQNAQDVQNTKDVKHTVRKGDTLYSIAMKYGMAPSELAGLNGLTAKAKVRAGQVLIVSSDASVKSDAPAPEPAHEKKTYKVKRGDTLWAIAQRFGVTVGDLVRMNSMGRHPRIRVGQRLLIPAEEAA